MKNKILGAILLIVVGSSCTKSFIELVPQTSSSAATFFQTDDDFNQAVTGTYKPLQTVYNTGYVMGEMRSDNAHYIYDPTNRGGAYVDRENIADFVDHTINSFSTSKYSACYSGIAKANAILKRIDGANISTASKANYKGQAQFLRAFYYFELVQYYGGVPLHLTEVTSVVEASLPRASKVDVYKQIITDATDAANLLPVTQNPKGRATRGSAKALLAYVYMTLKQYSDAEKVLRDLSSLGYSLLPDYAAIFDPTNKNNAESIFEVQYLAGTQGLQSNWIYVFAPSVPDTKNITGVTGNNQQLSGGWNTPTDDLISVYEANDKRKAISISPGYTDENGNFVAQPYVIKYLHPHTLFNNTNDDWMVYRYADMLLLLAECLNEQGNSGAAIPFLNQVRKRAGLPATTATGEVDLRDAIAKERRVELAFENHRWLDLVRTEQAVSVMNAYGIETKAKYSYLSPATYNVTENRLIFAIPQQELDINKLLIQNLGY